MEEMMNSLDIKKASVKVVGMNGQISLGKEFAARQVLVEERQPGVWLIRTAKVIPDDELWLHEPKAKNDMGRALAWARDNPLKESDPNAILRKLEHGEKSKPSRGGHKQRSVSGKLAGAR